MLWFARFAKELRLTQPIGLQTVIGVSSKQKFKQELTQKLTLGLKPKSILKLELKCTN